ncbi:hypothetical protein AJ80_03507 [Polytolypa hystricis UAMH7299]|uniref:Transaldolase n=1 Tax=Polytolypa hystricis (strain UAMH7299) TaxID=1447883 RepID=A0A2B7YJE3_POLH7|nr:hypothetical protein AJ80_03507 [Polytolypa hystricis UAMH7299]
MGVNTRKPILPAPTDSSFLDTTGGSGTGTDLATDISRRTDRTSYSIPDDGSPITISTRRKPNRDREERTLSSSHHSQTSLLIEYFEGGKKAGNLSSRPSVRVRVTPSAARKFKDKSDHIHITETPSGGRKPSYTRRISLSTPTRSREITERGEDDQSLSSVTSAGDDTPTARRLPLEIELSSEVSDRYIQPTSEFSSIPPDSMLDGTVAMSESRRRRSHSVSGDDLNDPKQAGNMLKTPTRRRSRSLSRERIAHKAAEKLSSAPRDVSRSKHRRGEKSRSRSVSKDLLEAELYTPRKRSSRHRDKDLSSVESSLLSNSALSPHLKSGDQYSFRSGTSKSSLNNPRLLETVEDAIRRLILPELKELKKDQKAEKNRLQFERDALGSRGSGSVASRDELGRRLSKHASAPDVTKPRLILTSNSKDSGLTLSDGKSDKPKESKRDKYRDSPHGKASSRRLSVDSTGSDNLHRKKSKGLRDAEAARLVGAALTTAALHHHDSQSSLDKMERRKRRSRSRSGSINETEVVFQKHGVPPMPLRSEIDSELTRESILSQRTTGTATPLHGEVIRGSPREMGSPATRTPTRTPHPTEQRYDEDYNDRELPEHDFLDEDTSTPTAHDAYADDYEDEDIEPGNYATTKFSNNRALSPIQSVASYKDEDASDHGENTLRQVDSPGDVNLDVDTNDQRLSIASFSSATSTDLARSTRPSDQSMQKHAALTESEDPSAELGYEESQMTSNIESQADSTGQRHSLAQESYDDDSRVDSRRMTTYSDDSYDDEFDHGQQVTKGVGANAEFVHTPVGVESAVASLHDPSVVDMGSFRSGNLSAAGSLGQLQNGSPVSVTRTREAPGSIPGSPLKQRQDVSSPDETSFQKRMGATSPPQSVSRSSNEQLDHPHMGASALPGAGSPIPEIGHIMDSESEINTNPSIIQGPIGGIPHESRDHWPYDPTPPRSMGNVLSPQPGIGDIHEQDPIVAADAQRDLDPQYYSGYGDIEPQAGDPYGDTRFGFTSPGAKDEGYISAANPPSNATPEPLAKGFGGMDNAIPDFSSPLSAGDPFTESHKRHLSGYSQGMASPLYDSATGRGIDRIQSKDIVALMDHLTVRDAQRNARDTEILVTLVRSAAEMRNSFEDMKKFIAQQDEILLDSNDKQHERTRAIGGPRPQPTGFSRTPRQSMADYDEDLRSKKKSVFRRAIKGLSMKNSNDLTNIEDMLVRLLGEVEALRAVQDGRPQGSGTHSTSLDSNDHLRAVLQDGYEPEGHAGTGSTDDRSAFPSNSPHSMGDMGTTGVRRDAERRISPVLEGDEDLEPLTSHERDLLDHQAAADTHAIGRHKRGGSMPLSTPPRVPLASGALSTDTTPKMSTDKSRKHKSSSSSFFPKISRWSKTTASSFGDNIRNSIQTARKERHSSEISRSGSDLGNYNTGDYYDPKGDDRLRSSSSLGHHAQENRPPSPLVPSQVSEKPKYKVHRDSLNLQHPQPRQGPTSRYQTHLESQAQNYHAPMSPHSDAWPSNPSLARVESNQRSVTGGRRSPISDAGYSEASSITGKSGPPRPPKIRHDDEPLVPQRTPKNSEIGSQPSYAERMAARNSFEGTNGSPKRMSPSAGPQRRPTGPRPITSSGKHGAGSSGFPKRQQYRGSPDQVDDDDDY